MCDDRYTIEYSIHVGSHPPLLLYSRAYMSLYSQINTDEKLEFGF